MKKKKYLLAIYYVGLICGALVMNYVLIQHEEITDQWLDMFLNLDNLMYVKKQELFIYILYKRLKQAVIFSIMYIYISKIALFIILLFYGAFIEGLTVSLFVYYKGIAGIFYSIYILVSGYMIYAGLIYFVFLRYMNKYNTKMKKANFEMLLLIFLIIICVIAEIALNNAVGMYFYRH